MAKKNITSEELCAALITHGTIRETAGVLNVSERTIYNMMSDEEFKQMYEYAQSDILSGCVTACQNKMIEAINVISVLMTDLNASPQTRLQAAQYMIKNGLTMYDMLTKVREKAEKETDLFDGQII